MAEWQGIDADEEDEENDNEYKFESYRDGLLFLIDASEEMFIKNEEGESPFSLSIKCARSVMGNKIFSYKNDLTGIVFYGTNVSRNVAEFKHIVVFQDMGLLDAERILEVEKLLKGDKKSFDDEFGHSNQYSLSDVFWICSSLISNCTMKLDSKRILLFTNKDNPHANNAQLQLQARQKALDLLENQIDMDVICVAAGTGSFDMNKFYKPLICSSVEDEANLQDPTDKLEELLSRIRKKVDKRRVLSRIPFELGDGVRMAVGIYNLVRPMRIPTATRLSKATNAELKTVRKTYLAETGEYLAVHDIKKYVEYGGAKIIMAQEEVKELKQFFEPGLTLMGFKPRESLKAYHYISPAKFLYPEEANVTGSTCLFASLLEKCLERNVYPICRFIQNRMTTPKFVALVPQKEVKENQIQVSPPGFHIIPLPFADDIRDFEFTATVKANDEQISKAKQIVRKLKFNFNSESFENPVLQKHWQNVEALALDKDMPEDIEDYIAPDHEDMKGRLGSLPKEFKDLVFPEGYNPGAGSKRKATGAVAAKRGKVAKEDEEEVEYDIKKEVKEKKLHALPMVVLKEFCRKLQIKHTGLKKADVVSAIYDKFDD